MARVVLLAGGTGGAKLARGLQDVCSLTVIANTGDDCEIYGAHVSPDPDLITFWLADRIDPRGWGLTEDTFAAMDMLRELGEDIWFNLGDQDLGLCLRRAWRLAAGASLEAVLDEHRRALGVPSRVLPMCEEPVRTRVRSGGEWHEFQEFMIRVRGPVEDVEFAGAHEAAPSPEALKALAAADAVVIGPSNPVISIGPILAMPGMREALRGCGAPVVAVSPLVRGAVLKGPTDAFMAWAGQPLSSDGIAAHYAGVIDGLVADEPVSGALPCLVRDVELGTADQRRDVASAVLEFATALTAAG